MRFSPALIQEYQNEITTTYGVVISAENAQVQLYSLVRCLFGCGGGAAGAYAPRAAAEVGDSITPTSGLLDKSYGQEK